MKKYLAVAVVSGLVGLGIAATIERALRFFHPRFRAAALGWPATANPLATLADPPARPPAWAVGLANSCPHAGHFTP